jgi:hypothetical protein
MRGIFIAVERGGGEGLLCSVSAGCGLLGEDKIILILQEKIISRFGY